jgi:hypothetical protein
MVEFPRLLRLQAQHCGRLGSPLYAGLLERAAVDAREGGPVAKLLRGHEDDPPDSMLALRLMGAVHRRVLEGELPDLRRRCAGSAGQAWPAFRAALAEDGEAIRGLLDRPVQTNEVGRCAALLPGFLAVAAGSGLPLRLLEVGASAGLNLRWDRYRYQADGFGWGDPASPVRIGFALEGPAPEEIVPEVRKRQGCDPNPVDPASEEGRLTLLSFVWADQAGWIERLRAALGGAGANPAAVERAGAADWIAERLAEPGEGTATVVFHSIVMQYLSAEERGSFEHHLLAAAEAADEAAPLAWLRMEPAGNRAEVRLTRWPAGEEQVVGWAGYHGDPVELPPPDGR